MKRLVFCVAVGLFVLTSCGPPVSVFPLSTEENCVAAPELIGAWVGDPDAFLRISEIEGKKGLKASWHDENECPAEFEIHATRLGDQLFWDFVPSENQRHQADNDVLEYHTLPLHSFARVDLQGDKLKLVFMDIEWLADESKSGNLGIAHVMFDGKVPMLTASSEDLRAFVAANASNPEAFVDDDDTLQFTRGK